MVTYDLPENYFDTYAGKIKGLTVDDINKTAKRIIKPENITWTVVGDKEKVYEGIKSLGYDIKLIDTNGNIIEETPSSVELKTE